MGRAKDETPEEGAKRSYPTLDLQNGSTVGVGQTTLLVSIEVSEQGTTQLYCQQCKKDVTIEAGPGRQGTFICSACRQSAQSQPQTPLQPPQTNMPEIIPGYQLVRELGRGGMGVVYLVQNIQDGHLAALKVMLPKVVVDEKAKIKFQRESHTTQILQHPYIVQFIDRGFHQGAFYFLLEYCEEGNLYDLMMRKGGKLTLKEAGPIMLQALDGLAYAHNEGFIHRDLKPQNILLSGKEGQWVAKIGDLGLAKSFEEAGFSGMTLTRDDPVGTIAYMSHEQLINFKYVKPVSDVWAIGATYYYILTGRLPRVKQPAEDTINMILYGESVPIRQRDRHIPPSVAAVIDRALTHKETERYQDAGQMYRALALALQQVT